MSLLKKASIITTPTAYAEDYLYSIKPAQSFGSELVPNGTFDSGISGWVENGGAVLSHISANNSLQSVSASGGKGAVLTASITVTVGKKYIVQAECVSVTGTCNLRIGTSTTGSQYLETSAVSIPTIFEHRLTATSTSLYIYLRNASASTTQWDNVSVREVTDADFDFDRNSTGTRVNEDYLIEDVPYNIFTYSENFSQDWLSGGAGAFTITPNSEISPDGTQNASKLITPVIGSQLRQNRAIINTQMSNSFYMRTNQGTRQMSIRINDNEITQTFTVTSEWKRYTVSGLVGGTLFGSGRCSLNNLDILDENNHVYIWGAQLVKGDQPKDYLKTTDRLDIPRIDYTNGEPSILLEPSRTNSYTYSSDFTQTFWSKQNGSSVSSNQTTSPEGVVNADKLISANLTNEQYLLNSGISTTSGDDITVSCFVKKLDYDYFHIRFTATDGVWVAASVWYNIDNGTLGTVESGITAEIIEYPNGWYRCVAKRTATGTGFGRVRLQLASSDNTPNVVGDGTKGTFIYGAQWEVGSYATSLIHTSGSAVTRSADAATNAGNSDLINSTEGVLYAEIKANSNDEGGRQITLSDGGSQNTVQVKYTTNENRIDGVVKSGNVNQSNMNHTVSTVLEYHKIAVKYKVNDFALWIDGEEVNTDSSGITPVGMNELAFDNGGGSVGFLGNCKMIAVFKEALSDEELACLTSPNNNEIFLNYYNRMQYVNATTEAMGCAQKTYTI